MDWKGTLLPFSDTQERSNILLVEVVEARSCHCFKIPALCHQAPSTADHIHSLYDGNSPFSRVQTLDLLKSLVRLALGQ